MSSNTITRPVLRYHGGKFRLATWIISHFPPHRIYCEPYGGAFSVGMRKERAYSEVYNDQWERVVQVFRVLRDPAQAAELEHALRLTPYARAEFEAAEADASLPLVEQARRTILRSFAGFGSASINGEHITGFRANSTREGSTPAQDWAGWPGLIPAFTRRLQGVVIECRPALEVLRHHDTPETLFYVDPPYLHLVRNMRRGNAAYAREMTDRDHIRLAVCLRRRVGMVILSGYPSALYERLYERRGWVRVETEALADGAQKRTEALWLNPAAQAALERARRTAAPVRQTALSFEPDPPPPPEPPAGPWLRPHATLPPPNARVRLQGQDGKPLEARVTDAAAGRLVLRVEQVGERRIKPYAVEFKQEECPALEVL